MPRVHAFVAVALAVTPCTGTGYAQDTQDIRVVKARLMDHDDLFVLVDTIRLDPSVLIGRIVDMDVNDKGEMLVTDDVAKAVYRFSATGQVLHDLEVEMCHPGADFGPSSARFIGNNRTIAWDGEGSAFIFDDTGRCTDYAKSDRLIAIGICASGDSIYALPFPRPKHMTMSVFGHNLEFLEEVPIEPLKWPNMAVTLARSGRQLACFDDGAWYIHIYNADATPLRAQATATHYQHPFFVERRRDFERLYGLRGWGEGSIVAALYNLDRATHVILHHSLRYSGDEKYGYTIVDHENRFSGISTMSPLRHLVGSGNGMLYYKGPNESLAGGEVGNPTIIRYRFAPPQDSND